MEMPKLEELKRVQKNHIEGGTAEDFGTKKREEIIEELSKVLGSVNKEKIDEISDLRVETRHNYVCTTKTIRGTIAGYYIVLEKNTDRPKDKELPLEYYAHVEGYDTDDVKIAGELFEKYEKAIELVSDLLHEQDVTVEAQKNEQEERNGENLALVIDVLKKY